MDKKDLKFYEAPASDVVELEAEAQILAGSVNSKENPFSDSTYEGEEDE
jgi:hypothetical protein